MSGKTFPSDRFGRLVAGLALLVVIVLAACGGQQGGTADHMHAGNTPAPAASAGDGEAVTITLTDFKITASRTTFVAGQTYRFAIANTSKTPHELAIAPVMGKGSAMTSDEMHQTALFHLNADQLPTGTVKTVVYTFTAPSPAGALEFGCHIVGHYDAGMHTPITVMAN